MHRYIYLIYDCFDMLNTITLNKPLDKVYKIYLIIIYVNISMIL